MGFWGRLSGDVERREFICGLFDGAGLGAGMSRAMKRSG